MINHLLYVSQSKRVFSEDDLYNLLDRARKKNEAYGITGMLIYHSSVFLQLIEGDKENVQAVFQKIKADERHSNIIVLSDEMVPKRLFEHWTMAYKKIDEIKPELLSEILFLSNQYLNDKKVPRLDSVMNILRKFRLSL